MSKTFRVLLTGAGGFVGHHTLAHLLKTTDWSFVCPDSFRHNGTTARLRAVEEEVPGFSRRVKVITHDLCAPIDEVTAKQIGEVDVIINMASLSNVDYSIDHPRKFVENNVALQLSMLDFARNLSHLKLFIQISTDEVYGDIIEGSHSETDLLKPSNPYSATKAAADMLVQAWARTYQIPYIIVRPTNNYGIGQYVEKLIPKTVKYLTVGKPIDLHDKGKPVRTWLHASDTARAVLTIIDSGVINEIYSPHIVKTISEFNK